MLSGADGVNVTGIFSRPLTKLAGRSGRFVVGCQPQIRQALAAAALHKRELQTGKLIPQAEMGAEAERQMVVRVAGDIEAAQGSSNTFSSKLADSNSRIIFSPSLELRAVELGVRGDGARHVLHRRGPAQHLLDCVRQQAQVVDQTLVLIGVEQKLPGTA